MKTTLTYGFLMALGGAALTLIMFFAGFHDSAEKMQQGQWVESVVSTLIAVTFLVLAIREKRSSYPVDHDWGYSAALGTGVMTGLFAGVFATVFGHVYFSYIHPGMSDVLYEMQVAGMEAKGLSATQIEQVEPMMRKWISPVMLTVFRGFFGFVWTVVLSAIIAIFLRRRATGDAATVAS
jgi:hypothetical protein